MSSWFIYYLIFIYGKLYYVLCGIVSIGTIGYLVFECVKFGVMFWDSLRYNEYTDEAKAEFKKLKRAVYLTLATTVIINLIPNRNQLLLIWGLPKLTNNETVVLSQKSWKYLDAYLDSRIKELKRKN